MTTGLYSNNFSRAFSRVLKKAGVSCYQVSRYTGLDQAYLSRLKRGQKNNPSPETIVKISLAIAHFSEKVTLRELESLFNAVGRSLQVRH